MCVETTKPKDPTETAKPGSGVLKQKLEHYRFLLNSMNDGFFVTDGEGVLSFANKALARIHGFDSPAELVGICFLDLVAPWMRDEVVQEFRKAISTGIAPELRDVALVRRDGHVVYGEIKPAVALQRDGTVITQGILRDITERKSAEETLRKSQDRLSLALKSSKAGTWDKDILSDNSTWDDELHTLFGLAAGAFSGKTEDFIRMLHPDDRERVKDEMATAVNGNAEYSTSYRVIWPDSSVHYLAGRGKVYRDSTGQAVRMIGVTLDVTDLKQAEEALWEAKQTYDELAVAAQVGIYKVKSNERGERVFDYVSPQWCEMNGFDQEEILGNPKLFFDRIHPEEREAFIELNHAARRTGDHFVWEGRIIIRDEVRFMHIESWPKRQKSGHIVWSGIQYDITERSQAQETLRRSEERWQFALEGSGDGVWDWNVQTNEVFFSRRWKTILGYEEDEIGNTLAEWEKRVHPADKEQCHKDLEEHLRGETPFYQNEHRIRCKDGSYKWILDRGKVISWTDDGKPLRAIGTHTDVTERKRAEEERLELDQRVQQVQKAESLGRMAGGIAHHFNNLLGAVMGNLELASYGLPQSAKLRGYITEAMKASRRAAEISRSMLTYLGQTTVKRESMDLTDVIGETLLLVGASLPKKLHLKVNLPSKEVEIVADVAHIRQILTNLVLNASEAIGEQEGFITVTLRAMAASDILESRIFPWDWKPAAKSYACVSVLDTGCGMDAEIQEKIFDPFFSTRFTGRGLGLSVTMGLVKTHEGALALESREGCGSSFRLYLPMSELEARR